jgi:hypothetical protein
MNEGRYIDPVNRNLDIILGIVALVLMSVFGYLYYEYNQNEATKQLYDIRDIKNNKWQSDFYDMSLEIKEETITLVKEGETLIDNAKFEFNSRTGEFVYKDGSNEVKETLYLRSIGNTSITIWYNYAEYSLNKYILTK